MFRCCVVSMFVEKSFTDASLSGLNKDFRKMISDHAYLKALTVKDILAAADGTRKVVFLVADILSTDLQNMIDF